MNITSEMTGDLQILTVQEKRIDAVAAIQFKDTVRELTAQHDAGVVLDLSQVEFIDSSGLGAIVASMKQLGKERPLHLADADRIKSFCPDSHGAGVQNLQVTARCASTKRGKKCLMDPS